jgi:cation diffusion facilitator family transporter
MSAASAPIDSWKHSHVFDEGNLAAERSTRRVVILTAAMMVVEIVAGLMFNSMALLADGLHMSSHATALGLSVLAYGFARKFAQSPCFAFGTWKIEVLGGYTSAVLLVVVALVMLYESVLRIVTPAAIRYDEAIVVACVGLLVNVVCAWWLKDGHQHSHNEASDHHHDHHKDLNLRSAYLHVVADAATSVLAIVALVGGKLWGAAWLDPVMGIVGAMLVLVWAYGLLRDTSRVLLDAEMNVEVVAEIRQVVRDAPITAEICDLHVWRVGKGKFACILSLVTADKLSADEVRQWLSVHEELVHITVEINS